MNSVEYVIDLHPLKADFDIRVLKHRANRITMKLTKRNAVQNINLGVLGNILDYAARVAGCATIGDCFVSECEISIHAYADIKELTVSVHLLESSQHIATFQCEIHTLLHRCKILIAESHGTLVKTKIELPVVA